MDEPVIRIFTERKGAVAAFKESARSGDEPDWVSGDIDEDGDRWTWYWTMAGAEARIMSIPVE